MGYHYMNKYLKDSSEQSAKDSSQQTGEAEHILEYEQLNITEEKNKLKYIFLFKAMIFLCGIVLLFTFINKNEILVYEFLLLYAVFELIRSIYEKRQRKKKEHAIIKTVSDKIDKYSLISMTIVLIASEALNFFENNINFNYLLLTMLMFFSFDLIHYYFNSEYLKRAEDYQQHIYYK